MLNKLSLFSVCALCLMRYGYRCDTDTDTPRHLEVCVEILTLNTKRPNFMLAISYKFQASFN